MSINEVVYVMTRGWNYEITEDERYLIPELKEVFQNNKLGSFRANVKAGKNYGELRELKL